MDYKVRFTESAHSDFYEIIDYLSQNESPSMALEFIDSLEKRIADTLSLFPLSGSEVFGARFFPFDNYIAVYDTNETDKTVDVLMISERHRQWRGIVGNRFKT